MRGDLSGEGVRFVAWPTGGRDGRASSSDPYWLEALRLRPRGPRASGPECRLRTCTPLLARGAAPTDFLPPMSPVVTSKPPSSIKEAHDVAFKRNGPPLRRE